MNYQKFKINLIYVNAKNMFLSKLKNITDPEKNGIGIFSCKVPWPLNLEEIKNFKANN